MPNSRTRNKAEKEDLLNPSLEELARLERENRRLARIREETTMPRAIITTRNAAGEFVDAAGNKYNAEGQRLDAAGRPIPDEPEPQQQQLQQYVAANPNMALADYNRPDEFFVHRSAIHPPTFERNDFELKLAYYTHVAQNPFQGLPSEYPMDHIEKLESIVGGIKANGVSKDFIYLQLFPHSLAGEAKSWLNSLPSGSLTTWESTRKAFLRYFYDDAKSEELRTKISTFKQGPQESFKSAWHRFQKLQRDCPHHGFTEQQLLSTFFRGVEWRYQVSLDSASNGNFMTRNPADAKDLIHNLSQSSSTKSIDAERVNAAGVGREAISAMQAQLATVVNMLKGKSVAGVEEIEAEEREVNWVSGNQYQRNQSNGYQGQNNGFNKAQQSGLSADVVQNMFQQLLDANAKQTGDFNQKLDKQYIALKSEIDQIKVHMKQLDVQVAQTAEGIKRQAGFLPGKTDTNPREHCNAVTTRSAKKSDDNSRDDSAQDLVEEELVDEEIICEEESNLGSKSKLSIDNSSIVDRQSGKSTNSQNCENLVDRQNQPIVDQHSIVDRQSKNVDRQSGNSSQTQICEKCVDRQSEQLSTNNPLSTDNLNTVDRQSPPGDKTTSNVNPKPNSSNPKPKVPYPRLPKMSKQELEEAKCREIMKELEVTIPFFDACNLAPTLRKYVKKMVSKAIPYDQGLMMVSEECSALIQSKMPKKLKDPGSFVLDCTIGHLKFERSLCDLGSSVNVMPLSVAKRLGFSEFKYTPTVLVLADRSTRTPEGVVEDIPVRVGNCWIPADFIVLDYEANEPRDPIILGRPFLATAGALIDCREGKIILRLDDMTMEFDMTKMLESPKIDGQTFVVEVLDEAVERSDEVMNDFGYLVQRCDQGVDKQMNVEAKSEKPSATPVTAVKQKAPKLTRHSPKPRYKNSKPSPSSAGRKFNPPRHAHPVAAVIPAYLGKPHAQNAYTPPWMRRLSKGPRPP